MTEWTPSVSVLLPVLDEIEMIDACLDSLASQDYGGPLEIVVADGGSGDGTRDRLDDWSRRIELTVIDNPRRRQSHGLNAAALVARGEVLVRADAHTTYAGDYVSAAVRALEDVAGGAVGGSISPVASGGFGEAVARAMRTKVAIGSGRFHDDSAAGEVDTVYLGAFRAEDFDAVGGFRAFPSGAGEDADFYYRMRRLGRRVVLDPSIRSSYRPRTTARGLAVQFFRYGRVKAEMLWVNRVLPSWRPLAPAALTAALLVGAGFAVFAGAVLPLAITGGIWLGALLGAALPHGRWAPMVVIAGAIMHLAYGIGAWWGVLRGPQPVRRSLGA